MNQNAVSNTINIYNSEINKIRQKKKLLHLQHANVHTSDTELAKLLYISLPTCTALLNALIASDYLKNIRVGELSVCRKRRDPKTTALLKAIMKRIARRFEDKIVSLLIPHFNEYPERVTTEDVFLSARLGDEFCIGILSEIRKSIGKGLSYIIQLLNPEVIALSGTISKAKQYVLYPIQQSLNHHCLEKISESTPIIISDMGNQSALLGTSEMISQKFFMEMNFTDTIQTY